MKIVYLPLKRRQGCSSRSMADGLIWHSSASKLALTDSSPCCRITLASLPINGFGRLKYNRSLTFHILRNASMTLYLKRGGRISSGVRHGRPIDLRYMQTVGQRGRHARISNKARTVVRVSQTRMMQGRAKKERAQVIKEAVYVGVDVAKGTLDVAVSNSQGTHQFDNDHEGIAHAIRYIASLQPAGIILEATGRLEMPLAAELQAKCLPVVIINPRQVRDFASATGALAKTDAIDARLPALFGLRIKPEVRPLPDKQAHEMASLLTRRR